jgi:hypothetical protein
MTGIADAGWLVDMTAHTPHAHDVVDPEIVGASLDKHHPRPSVLSSISPSAADDNDERRAATQDRI